MVAFNMALVYSLLGVLALVVVDTILGIALSLKVGDFDLSKLPQFLKTNVLPYFLTLTALVGLAQLPDWNSVGTVATAGAFIAAYALKLFKEIGEKLVELFGSTPPLEIPQDLQDFSDLR